MTVSHHPEQHFSSQFKHSKGMAPLINVQYMDSKLNFHKFLDKKAGHIIIKTMVKSKSKNSFMQCYRLSWKDPCKSKFIKRTHVLVWVGTNDC